jgi:hypothetical protein
MQQALGYAEILEVPSAFSSNGDAFASYNKMPIHGEDMETQFPLEKFPSPQTLWQRYKSYRGIEEKSEELVLQPYHLDGSGKEPRYYGATTGIATINNLKKSFSMLSSVALLKLPQGISNAYLLLSLRSPYFYDEMRAGMTGVAITRVTLTKLNDACFSLPPTAEQHRIVAKVDELIAICDTLKARLNDAQTTQVQLADAIVERSV